MSIKEELGLDCKGKCNANCCRYAFVPLGGEDHARWFAAHGHRVFRIEGTEEYRGLVKVDCRFLTDAGLCKVFGTERRPKMCDEFWCDRMPEYLEVIYEDQRIDSVHPS